VQLLPLGLDRSLEQRGHLVVLVADLAIGQGTKLTLERGSSPLRLPEDRLDIIGKLGERAGRSFIAERTFELVDLTEDIGRRFLPGRAPRLILGPLPDRASVKSSRGKSGVKKAWSR